MYHLVLLYSLFYNIFSPISGIMLPALHSVTASRLLVASGGLETGETMASLLTTPGVVLYWPD